MTTNHVYKKKDSSFDYRLDFIRFIAFLLVFICHFVHNGGVGIQNNPSTWWNNQIIQRFANFGREGVTIFFVLSGFLLGKLLLKEFILTSKISVKKFYLRRIYRIWPLYILFLFICLLVNYVTDDTGFTNQEIPFLLTFTYNWGLLFGKTGSTISSISWSLSIEEQIYLFLPLMSYLKFKNRFTVGTFIFFLFGTTSLVICDLLKLNSTYFTTSYFLPVSIGLFIAIYEEKLRVYLINYKIITIFSISYLLFYPFFYPDLKYLGLNTIIFYLSCLYFICLLHTTDKYLKTNRFVYLLAKIGRVSYGCYLYHFIILYIFINYELLFDKKSGFLLLGVVSAFIVTVVISYISYYCFEIFFLKKKQRL